MLYHNHLHGVLLHANPITRYILLTHVPLFQNVSTPSPLTVDFEDLITSGSVRLIDFVHKNIVRIKMTPTLTRLAAERGDVAVMEWLCRNRCPWHDMTMSIAAQRGHTGMVEYLLTVGCPQNEWMLVSAAEQGHVHILSLLVNNTCFNLTSIVPTFAVLGRSMPVIEWLHEQKRHHKRCPRFFQTPIQCAIKTNFIEALDFFHRKGVTFPQNTRRLAMEWQRTEVLAWLVDKGIP
jgi:hypothetical protein